jgi:hypothetical protein
MIKLISLTTDKLSRKEILQICILKNTFWKHGLKSNINWFKSNVKNKDIHNLLYYKNIFVGYSLLRKRIFFYKKTKKNYLYSDTLIIKKKFRNLKLASILWNFNSEIIIMSKFHAFLICEKHIKPFHKRFNWKSIKKSEYQMMDHIPSFKPYFPMVFNLDNKLFGIKKKYFVTNLIKKVL